MPQATGLQTSANKSRRLVSLPVRIRATAPICDDQEDLLIPSPIKGAAQERTAAVDHRRASLWTTRARRRVAAPDRHCGRPRQQVRGPALLRFEIGAHPGRVGDAPAGTRDGAAAADVRRTWRSRLQRASTVGYAAVS